LAQTGISRYIQRYLHHVELSDNAYVLNPIDVGIRIKQARKAKGLTQKQLAAKAGLSNSTLSDIERGQLDPKLSQVSAICQCLGLDLNWLYGYTINDLDRQIDSGELDLHSWLKFKDLNYQYRKRIYDEIHFLFDVQERLKDEK